MLSNRTIKFTNSTQFNDPFDSHPSLIDVSNVPEEKTKVWGKDAIMKIEANRFERAREEAWICCLSKVHDSILMWSYYNNHQGACIGLNMENTRKYLANMRGLLYLECFEWEVQYKDILDKPDYFNCKEDLFKYQLATKASDWKHEKEVRLVSINPSPDYFPPFENQKGAKELIPCEELNAFLEIGRECFESLYLGVNMNNEDKKDLIASARICNPNIKIYQMELDPDAFRFKEVLIDM